MSIHTWRFMIYKGRSFSSEKIGCALLNQVFFYCTQFKWNVCIFCPSALTSAKSWNFNFAWAESIFSASRSLGYTHGQRNIKQNSTTLAVRMSDETSRNDKMCESTWLNIYSVNKTMPATRNSVSLVFFFLKIKIHQKWLKTWIVKSVLKSHCLVFYTKWSISPGRDVTFFNYYLNKQSRSI